LLPGISGHEVRHPDTLTRIAAFEHVQRLSEMHDPLTANELRPASFSTVSASRWSTRSGEFSSLDKCNFCCRSGPYFHGPAHASGTMISGRYTTRLPVLPMLAGSLIEMAGQDDSQSAVSTSRYSTTRKALLPFWRIVGDIVNAYPRAAQHGADDPPTPLPEEACF